MATDVSLKQGNDDIFEEHFESNYFEDLKNLQSLENERIAAMLKSIDQAAVPNLNPRVVFYTTPVLQEPSFVSKVAQAFLSNKKKPARSVEEIMKDVFEEEFFCDEYFMEDWTAPALEAMLPKQMLKEEVKPASATSAQTILSPIRWNKEDKIKIWKAYFADKVKSLENAIRSFLDFRFLHWEFDFSREFVAKSAYAALCIFVTIPFGMVAAQRLNLPITSYWGVEARAEDLSRINENQKEIMVQVEDKTIQLPVVPQAEESQQKLTPQNLKIVTPATGEAATSGEYTSHTQTGQDEAVYTSREVYEPVYDYAYTEAAWVEPVKEPEPKVENVAIPEVIPEAIPQEQAIPNSTETPKIEQPEPVNTAPVEVQQPQPQAKPAMPAPLPSSEAFMRPASVK